MVGYVSLRCWLRPFLTAPEIGRRRGSWVVYRSRMTSDPPHPAVTRVSRQAGIENLADILASLPGSDFASLLLGVSRSRVEACSAAHVMSQRTRDRFVWPAAIDFHQLRWVQDAAIAAVRNSFEFVTLAPLVPFGTHASLGDVSQNNVVTTVRGTEVAADPTNALAIEAAMRRIERVDSGVRLAAIQRVVRAQRFSGSRSFAHFELLGLVSADRDSGNHDFAVDEIVRHAEVVAGIVVACGATSVRIRVSDFSGRLHIGVDRVLDGLRERRIVADEWAEREAGRGYYPELCFKVVGVFDGEAVEVGDGGLVAWTQLLLNNAKERLLISGLSLERLAMLRSPRPDPC